MWRRTVAERGVLWYNFQAMSGYVNIQDEAFRMLASGYLSLYRIDLDEDRITTLFLSADRDLQSIKPLLEKHAKYSELMVEWAENRVHPDFHDQMAAYGRIDYLREVLRHAKRHTVRYVRSIAGHEQWLEMVLTKAEEVDEEPRTVFMRFVDCDEDQRRRLDDEAAHDRRSIINAIHTALGSGEWEIARNPDGTPGSCYWSPAFRRLVGCGEMSAEEFGTDIHAWMDRLHPSDLERIRDAILSTVSDPTGGKIYDVKYRIRVEGKGYRWFRAAGSARENGRGEVVAINGVFIDIDDQVRANEAKSYFFSTVSHDIRTPLNAICGFAEVLELGVEGEEERKSYVSSIRSSGKLLLELINDVLDLSKLESGKMEIAPEPTDIKHLVDEVVSAFQVVKSSKGVEVAAEFDEIPEFVQLDPQRVRQILFNLIGNAMKFTDRGSITVRLGMKGKTLVMSVADTGRGIPADKLDMILQPYVQVSADKGASGTGLGLPICKQLVELMGGVMRVESEVGVGSTFTLEIPNVIAKAVDVEYIKTSSGRIIPVTKELHVLAVDDVPVNLKLLDVFARRLGVKKVTTAVDGHDAFKKLESCLAVGDPVNLVLTDMWMPKMDGEQLCRAIRADDRFASLRVIALTADVEANKNFREIGFDGILLKPMTLAKFRDILS